MVRVVKVAMIRTKQGSLANCGMTLRRIEISVLLPITTKADAQAKEIAAKDEAISSDESDKMRREDIGLTGITEKIAACVAEAEALDVPEVFSSPQLSKELAEILMKRWNSGESLYESNVKKAFRNLREERLQCSQHLHDVRAAFRDFLFSLDDKQVDMDLFVRKFNAIDQDMRFDVPTIGPQTVQRVHDAKGRAIAIEAGKTILVERERTLELAKQKGITIVAMDDAEMNSGDRTFARESDRRVA